MIVNGALTNALWACENNNKVALLVIDESYNAYENEISNTPFLGGGADSNVTACQQRLIVLIQRLGGHIWSICYRPNRIAMDGNFRDPTRLSLRALYNPNHQHHILAKPRASAFKETFLHQELQRLGINTVVIMGYFSYACVMATINDAKKHNYNVMVTDKILHGGTLSPMYRDPNNPVKFYTSL